MNLFEKIDSYSSLEKGWDSYRADPPNELSRNNAKKFLELCIKLDFIPYRVCPTAMGGMAMTWKENSEKVFMEFYNTGKIYYLAAHEEDSTNDVIVKEVIEYDKGLQEIMEFFQSK